MSLRFSHIALNCRDMAVIEAFYSRHFGFRRARVIDLGNEQIVFLRAGDMYLELFQAKGEAPAPLADHDGPTYAGVRHLAFQVDDVDAALDSLATETDITLGPLEFDAFIPGWKTAWVSDPEGNIVEISQGFVDQENPPEFAPELQHAAE